MRFDFAKATIGLRNGISDYTTPEAMVTRAKL
jgi:hypothetical protein